MQATCHLTGTEGTVHGADQTNLDFTNSDKDMVYQCYFSETSAAFNLTEAK